MRSVIPLYHTGYRGRPQYSVFRIPRIMGNGKMPLSGVRHRGSRNDPKGASDSIVTLSVVTSRSNNSYLKSDWSASE